MKTSRDYAPYRAGTVMPIVRAALARGAIVPAGRHHRFGRRLFRHDTINALLASGEARRLPDGRVVASEILDEAAQ